MDRKKLEPDAGGEKMKHLNCSAPFLEAELFGKLERIYTKRVEARPPGVQICSHKKVMAIVHERVRQQRRTMPPGYILVWDLSDDRVRRDRVCRWTNSKLLPFRRVFVGGRWAVAVPEIRARELMAMNRDEIENERRRLFGKPKKKKRQRGKKPNLDGFITTRRATEILQCGRGMVAKWADRGILERIKTSYTSYYKKSDVLCHAKARRGGRL